MRRVIPAAGTALALIMLTGCSVDTLIWGAEGAGVIETTERVIEAAQSGEARSLACESADVDFGDPADWRGLTAGEPEQFNPDYWGDLASLEPAWKINLELGGERATSGHVFPGDVFYREAADRLCVIDIVWSTVVVSG